MCGACGILSGAPDWADGLGPMPGTTALAERYRRIALVNRLLVPSAVRLRDVGGRLVVQSATGRTRIVADLAHVWQAADDVGQRPVDPLRESAR